MRTIDMRTHKQILWKYSLKNNNNNRKPHKGATNQPGCKTNKTDVLREKTGLKTKKQQTGLTLKTILA